MSIFSNIASALFKTVNQIHGDDYVYTHKEGGTSPISAVFENAYVEVQGVTSLKPILKNVIRTELASAPVKGDTVEINSDTYRVVEPQSDGSGSYILILEKQ